VTSAWARPRGARAGTGLVPGPGQNRRVGLAWPRLPATAEVAIVAAGYAGYALVRLAVRASPAAIAHAAGLWRAERWLHLDIEPSLNHLAAARPVLAETAGYYYGLAHFIVTPLVLGWLWLRAARRLVDHRGAHPQPQAPHRRLDVLVQQLGRRGADRPGGRQPGRRRPAAVGPPLTSPVVRVLTGARTRTTGTPDGLAP